MNISDTMIFIFPWSPLPPLFRGWFPTHQCFSRGWSSSKRNFTILKMVATTCRVFVELHEKKSWNNLMVILSTMKPSVLWFGYCLSDIDTTRSWWRSVPVVVAVVSLGYWWKTAYHMVVLMLWNPIAKRDIAFSISSRLVSPIFSFLNHQKPSFVQPSCKKTFPEFFS